jgi:hypothetical protein
VGCGRTDVFELGDPSPTEPIPGEPVSKKPRAIFVRDEQLRCPRAGSMTDLEPQPGERVVAADLRLLGECSGAGGEWIIGRIPAEGRDIMFGEHACYFLSPRAPENAGPNAPTAFGVVWMSHAAILYEGPVGWCITDADGGEPVVSDVSVRAVALYDSKAAAEAAAASW